MDTIKKPSLWFGALIGALLTMTLTSVLFLADQLAGLPFIPFDVFDFVSRNLPGPLLTFGIDVMVDIIIAFNMGETSVAAKSAEQLMGLGAFLVLGTIANVVLYAVLNRSKSSARNLYPGMIFGLAFGAIMMLVSLQINLTATAAMPAQVVWTLFSFTLWAVAANWIYNVLAHSGAKTKVDEETGETITVEALDRRQFMVRIGGASAVLTVIGAGLGAFIGNRPGAGQGLPAKPRAHPMAMCCPTSKAIWNRRRARDRNIHRLTITIASTSVRVRR